MTVESTVDEIKEQPTLIWVKPESNVQAMGGLVTASITEHKKVTVRAIGAGAVNQAIKSVIKARQFMAGQGEDLIVRPGFVDVTGNDGSPVTAIVLICTLF
jgi:stage V sporulation protein S